MTRRRVLFAIVAVGLVLAGGAYVGAGLLDGPTTSPTDADAPAEDEMIEPVDNATQMWPYTSRQRGVEGRTLAINVVIQGEPERVRQALIRDTDIGFEELPPDEVDAEGDAYQIDADAGGVDWDDAHGSTRYSFFQTEDRGIWVDESYQLHTGEYLGQRFHIRGYDDPGGEYSAIQIHREYFDFFRLRHVVTDIDDSSVMLEDEFINEPRVEEVRREYRGLSGGWSDGWISVIELGVLVPGGLLALFLFGSVTTKSTREAAVTLSKGLSQWLQDHWQGFALVAVLIVLVTGVRTAGIALERTFPDISTQLFAGAVYPVLALGPPVAVIVLCRRFDPLPAFTFAVVGLGAAFTLDTLWVGLGVVPVRLVLHRVGLLLALGIIAIGAARESNGERTVDAERAVLVGVGLLAWFTGLIMPLLDMI